MEIKASNLTHTFFRQEFGAELMAELDKIEYYVKCNSAIESIENMDSDRMQGLLELQNINKLNPGEQKRVLDKNKDIIAPLLMMAGGTQQTSIPLDSVMRVTWAMNRSAMYPKQDIPNFDQWLEEYEDFDFASEFNNIYKEIQRGFFRSRNK